jgi:outer membrane protein, multidrug efflux system
MRVRYANVVVGALIATVLAGCSLEPTYHAPALPVANQWPIPAQGGNAGTAARDVGWHDFFTDANLQTLIGQALANNRDLRVTILNVESARAQYRIQRADRLPTIGATGSFTHQKLPPALSFGESDSVSEYYQAGLGITAFEIDLFGRVRSLSHAALEQYFSQEESRRNAQLVLIAEVANAYLTLAADRQSLQVAQQTFKSQDDSYALTQKRYETGAISGLDLAQALTTVEAARGDVARYDGNVAQDINALTLLVGSNIDLNLLPQSLDATVIGQAPLPADLPSSVLLRRPDVMAAEHTLRGSNANIGAARAAFFPTISLTANEGYASEQLSGLFKAGAATWTFLPQVTLPIFDAGALRGNLQAAHVNHDIAVAQYEKTIQTAFREVADALALSGTLSREQTAARALVDASTQAFELSQRRFKAGRDSYLIVLDSQRSNYAAQQSLIAIRLAEQSNRVNLYKALGGGWAK